MAENCRCHRPRNEAWWKEFPATGKGNSPTERALIPGHLSIAVSGRSADDLANAAGFHLFQGFGNHRKAWAGALSSTSIAERDGAPRPLRRLEEPKTLAEEDTQFLPRQALTGEAALGRRSHNRPLARSVIGSENACDSCILHRLSFYNK